MSDELADRINDCIPHECPECGQECTCCRRMCSHPDTAECGVLQNWQELPEWR